MTNANRIDQPIEVAVGQRDSAKAGAVKLTRFKKTDAKADTAGNATPAASRKDTKCDLILKRLRSAKGATLAQLVDATGWQAHSVRGYLSGTVKKKLGLHLISETGKDRVRRYRVVESAPNSTVTVSNVGPDAA